MIFASTLVMQLQCRWMKMNTMLPWNVVVSLYIYHGFISIVYGNFSVWRCSFFKIFVHTTVWKEVSYIWYVRHLCNFFALFTFSYGYNIIFLSYSHCHGCWFLMLFIMGSYSLLLLNSVLGVWSPNFNSHHVMSALPFRSSGIFVNVRVNFRNL